MDTSSSDNDKETIDNEDMSPINDEIEYPQSENNSQPIENTHETIEEFAFTIVGGTFGEDGELFIEGNTVYIFSDEELKFELDDIKNIEIKQIEKKVSINYWILLAGILLTIYMSLIFGLWGFLIFTVLTVWNSYEPNPAHRIASIYLTSGEQIDVIGPVDDLLSLV